MQNKEEIYHHLQDVMVELFELDKEDLTLEANLYEDLDIDSIDAVDLMVKLKELTGRKMQPEEFKNVRTMQDIVDSVYQLLQQPAGE